MDRVENFILGGFVLVNGDPDLFRETHEGCLFGLRIEQFFVITAR